MFHLAIPALAAMLLDPIMNMVTAGEQRSNCICQQNPMCCVVQLHWCMDV